MQKLLIRAEDKNRWERRAPIVPADLAAILSDTGARALVEKSPKRFFSQDQYAAAGAASCDGMADGDIILGVKEIPVEKLLDGKTYLFFSHTIKGQSENMPLLQRIIDGGSTLIDYEKITDKKGRRLIYFGPFAGDAGAIDIISLMGEHWAKRGIETPFADVRRAHQYDSVQAAREHLTEIGRKIQHDGLPAEICPLTVGILGYGNVSGGAQAIFDCLPTERIPADMLNIFVTEGRGNRRTVYLTVFKEQDLVKPIAADAGQRGLLGKALSPICHLGGIETLGRNDIAPQAQRHCRHHLRHLWFDRVQCQNYRQRHAGLPRGPGRANNPRRPSGARNRPVGRGQSTL